MKFNNIGNGKTLLGVGPMSWNCIDAVIEVANEQEIPIKLIASRRQVECEILGGGYVTTTEKLARYVRDKDKKGLVYLARDHGGPWQGIGEENLSHGEAFRNAYISFMKDVGAGFDILHIDPSLKSRPIEEIINDIKLLHTRCKMHASTLGKEIFYECGTEEHCGQISNVENFEKFVHSVKDLHNMKFVVGNMGYWVKELKNVGKLDEEQAREFIRICNENNLFLKGHNSDYLTAAQLQQYVDIGVHSINIAPELGTRETTEILLMLECQKSLREKFIKLVNDSGKWKKWVRSGFDLLLWSSQSAKEEYLTKICGHYVLNTPQCELIKSVAKEWNDNRIKEGLKIHILAILQQLGWEIL